MKYFYIFLGLTLWVGAVAVSANTLISRDNGIVLEKAKQYVSDMTNKTHLTPKFIYKNVVVTIPNTNTEPNTAPTKSTPQATSVPPQTPKIKDTRHEDSDERFGGDGLDD